MSPASIVRLAGCQAVAVDGPDATAFLQSQTMNDVLALAPGQWHWNGILNAKGRVLFLFRLLRQEEHRYLLIQSVPRAAALAAHLSTFRFRARARIAPRPELAVWGRLNPVPMLPAGTASVGADDAVELSLAPLRAAHLVVGTAAPAPEAAEDGWWKEEMLSGAVRIHEPLAGAHTPQMLGLELLGAFSLRKGCYPGQEIVARTHYLGVPKRGLVILRGSSRREPGEKLLDLRGEPLAEVVDAAGAPPDRILACIAPLTLRGPVVATAEGALTLQEPRRSVRVG